MITQSLILPIHISPCLVINLVVASHVIVVILCLQSQDLVLLDISNPSGHLENDMFNILYSSILYTFKL